MGANATTIDYLPLLGRDEAVLDPKNRILIGKKMRERLGQNFALWLGPLGCIVGLPSPAWQAIVELLREADAANAGRELIEHLIFPTADDQLNCDEQGRILLNRTLRTSAGLADQAVVQGCNEHLEIWAPEKLMRYEEDREGYNLPRRKEWRRAWELLSAAEPRPHPIDRVLKRMSGL